MSLYVVDVEADGPSPANYSMVCFGAVRIDLKTTFYGQTGPIHYRWDPEALTISGFTRKQHEAFPEPIETMRRFNEWVRSTTNGPPVFISDNPAFDWQWINYYFDRCEIKNPFGFSARRIGDLYCGMTKDWRGNSIWKKMYRKTVHDHNPVNDAKGNAEALYTMLSSFRNLPEELK